MTASMTPPEPRRRGRPRASAPLHMVVMRELTNAMRQIRTTAGYESLDAAAETLNAAILRLYPRAAEQATEALGYEPHLVSPRYVSDIERGNGSKADVPTWLLTSGAYRADQLRSSQVPPWLVRAYDLAFAADEYLVGLYHWAVTVQADQAELPPKASLTRRLTPRNLAGYDRIIRAFASAPDETIGILASYKERLTRYPTCPPGAQRWLPHSRDRCTHNDHPVDVIPEGVLALPGAFLLGRWLLRNSGETPWEERVFFRAGRFDAGLVTPPFAPVNHTRPGEVADIVVPVRAPDRPGTYRACFRLGWPNGVYCYPNTLVGSIITVVVLPGELASCLKSWTVL